MVSVPCALIVSLTMVLAAVAVAMPSETKESFAVIPMQWSDAYFKRRLQQVQYDHIRSIWLAQLQKEKENPSSPPSGLPDAWKNNMMQMGRMLGDIKSRSITRKPNDAPTLPFLPTEAVPQQVPIPDANIPDTYLRLRGVPYGRPTTQTPRA